MGVIRTVIVVTCPTVDDETVLKLAVRGPDCVVKEKELSEVSIWALALV